MFPLTQPDMVHIETFTKIIDEVILHFWDQTSIVKLATVSQHSHKKNHNIILSNSLQKEVSIEYFTPLFWNIKWSSRVKL
jgi:hypothetical protein